jgi:hypothetical protein
MNRQGFLRILLSLLLLATQQMGLSHALSHLGMAQPPAVLQQDGDDDGRAKSLALDAGCQQCLAFAQLAGPLASTPFAFALPALSDAHFILAAADGQPRHSACPFQSRAPPLA